MFKFFSKGVDKSGFKIVSKEGMSVMSDMEKLEKLSDLIDDYYSTDDSKKENAHRKIKISNLVHQ